MLGEVDGSEAGGADAVISPPGPTNTTSVALARVPPGAQQPRGGVSAARAITATAGARVGALIARATVEPALAALGLAAARVRYSSAVRVERALPYHRDRQSAHRLDMYWPRAKAGPLPVVLYFHGGGFHTMSKDSHWFMAFPFARHGSLVVNANYRMLPGYPFPASLMDCARVLEWVAGHADSLGLDLDRLVFAGDSAGANLAASLALLCCFPRPEPWAKRVFDLGLTPRALVAFYGLLQVSDPGRFRRNAPRVPLWVDAELREISTRYLEVDPRLLDVTLELADPLLVLESDAKPQRQLPACLAAVGTRDPLVADTNRLEAACARRGVRCVAHRYEGQLHGFGAAAWSPAVTRLWKDTLAFLDGQFAEVPS